MTSKEKQTPSIEMMNELEPINPTEYDESDDLESVKKIAAISALELKAYNQVVSGRWDWYGLGDD